MINCPIIEFELGIMIPGTIRYKVESVTTINIISIAMNKSKNISMAILRNFGICISFGLKNSV